MIAIVDYGAGNIFSVKNALDYLGIESRLTSDPAELEAAESIILPGVGAFPAAMEMLEKRGLTGILKEQAKKKPLLGICLGMQMLFEKSFEFGECEGLGLIKGYVDKMEEPGLVIPHMGWNKLVYNHESPLFKGLEESYVYFVHSYKASVRTSPSTPTVSTVIPFPPWWATENTSGAASSTRRNPVRRVSLYCAISQH